TSVILLLMLIVGTISPVQAEELNRLSVQPLPTAQLSPTPDPTVTAQPSPTPDPTVTALEKDRAALEVEKLKIENANSERNIFSCRGFINLLYGNDSFLLVII